MFTESILHHLGRRILILLTQKKISPLKIMTDTNTNSTLHSQSKWNGIEISQLATTKIRKYFSPKPAKFYGQVYPFYPSRCSLRWQLNIVEMP
jgi:hypothetical protein